MYFILVTLITILLMVLGLSLDADRTFSYEAFASPLVYALLGVLPGFILPQEKELSVKVHMIKNAVEIVLVEAMILGVAFWSDTIPTEKYGVVIGIALGILVVYGLSSLIEYLFELNESKEMNEYLNSFQNRNATK